MKLPVDPHVGKFLIYAALLGGLPDAATVAAALGYGRPVFLAPPDAREAASRAKAALAGASRSDHFATAEGFRKWEAARREGGRGAAARVAQVSGVVGVGVGVGVWVVASGVCLWQTASRLALSIRNSRSVSCRTRRWST